VQRLGVVLSKNGEAGEMENRNAIFRGAAASSTIAQLVTIA